MIDTKTIALPMANLHAGSGEPLDKATMSTGSLVTPVAPPVVIRLDNASKIFQLYRSPWSRLSTAMAGAEESKKSQPRSEHRAVDGVSFDIRKGETVGILGINGAGKSTLLQLITGTLTPTSGSVKVVGRISALLELGAGFNPEWSGRRNAEFQCIMSGVPSSEVAGRIATIAEFADIGDFFDQPTRTYSSGMFLRVAFASAISTNPDILIVDEALAVGDVKFQNKCFRRFEELQAQGCTVLFVSHAPDLVTRFCSRGIIMHQGRVLHDGDTQDTVQIYFNLTTNAPVHRASTKKDAGKLDVVEFAAHEANAAPTAIMQARETWAARCESRSSYNAEELISGNGKGTIVDAMLHDGNFNEITHPLRPGETVHLVVRSVLHEPLKHPELGIILRSSTGQILCGASNRMLTKDELTFREPTVFDTNWRFTANFLPGEYFIDIGVAELNRDKRTVYELRQSTLHFSVRASTEVFGLVQADISFLGCDDRKQL
jgi:lipopolysaccharide transport system ATP-binding protein